MEVGALNRGFDIQRSLNGVKRDIEAWEKAEQPVAPFDVCDVPPVSKEWLAYKRGEIERLQRRHDDLTAEFRAL